MDPRPPAHRLEVDGEVFEVRPSEHQQGFDVDWVSGPNAGYGFSCGVQVTASAADEVPRKAPDIEDHDLVASIRSFLRQIDPQTGYIAD
ncbi:hypothetical protein KDN32_05780 [Nocardioides sp. J2M5]|uniref:hypothetical protein n=1 Tax=Nocardioides palaemonis TaxID=2829810 RepID=UPI001BACB651|nr:hypothetical protein [Nocardioides palaemonis]MBS2937245.1 hypothetical protein [Nocardioides palaemonis]